MFIIKYIALQSILSKVYLGNKTDGQSLRANVSVVMMLLKYSEQCFIRAGFNTLSRQTS